MKIKYNDFFIPDLEFLLLQYICFCFLNDIEDKKNLAKDRIRRYEEIINKILQTQDSDLAYIYPILQLTCHFCYFIDMEASSKKHIVPFFPNLLCYENNAEFKPRLPYVKALINKKILTSCSGMIFENKYLIGCEVRNYDGMPVTWYDDGKNPNDIINSIVILFLLLHFLNETEEKDNYDTMIHRNRPRRDNDKSETEEDDSELLPNIATFIGGKYINADKEIKGKGNFIINGIDSSYKWHTISRRYKGIIFQFRFFFDDLVKEYEKIYQRKNIFKYIPKEELKKYLIEHKRILTSFKKKGKNNKLDPEIIDLIIDCIQKDF